MACAVRGRPGLRRGYAQRRLTKVGMPAEQGTRGHEQAQLAKVPAGQQPGQRGQDRPIGRGQPRSPDLAPEHGDLLAQQEDLGVLGLVRAGEQGEPAEDAEGH
jgi:hypothetical protein